MDVHINTNIQKVAIVTQKKSTRAIRESYTISIVPGNDFLNSISWRESPKVSRHYFADQSIEHQRDICDGVPYGTGTPWSAQSSNATFAGQQQIVLRG